MINNSFLKAQSGNGTQLQYTYDNNGNRLTRTVIDNFTITLGKTGITDTLQSKKYVPITNVSNDFKINVWPNPTTSTISIGLQSTDLKQKQEFEYVVTSITGSLLLQNKVFTNNTELDLSGLNNGIYLLKLIANNKTYIYKILKVN